MCGTETVLVAAMMKNGRCKNKPGNITSASWPILVLQQEIPVDSCFGCPPCASEHALQRLLVGFLGSACLDIPHAEGDMPACADNDIVFGIYIFVFRFVEAHVAHDSVNESSRERCLARMVYLAFEVGRQPDSDVGCSTLNLQVKLGLRIIAALDRERASVIGRRGSVRPRRTTLTRIGAVSLPTNMLMR